MIQPLRTAAVLGAGVMGTQISALLANAGLTVHLLDLAAPGENKNAMIESAFKKAQKQNPPIFFTTRTARRVILGNFENDWQRLAEVDWVIEAVIEDLEIKQQLMARLEAVINHRAVITTNTSGLPIHEIAQGRSLEFRQRFLGSHFFNPPRYLKLLELIPTLDTDPQVLEGLQNFGRLRLGKGVVIAKDTPGFIGNRIGMYAIMLGLRAWLEQGYTLEEIDTLTGTLVGRPKSATFRTADLVGLDTLLHVADHLYSAVRDENREIFNAPSILRQLVERGALGAKTGAGFYRKQDRQILSINPGTLTYEPAKPPHLGNLDAIAKIDDLGERLRTLYRDEGRAGAFFRTLILQLLGYSGRRIPEIADSPAALDQAIRWGFGWQLGPFQIWDALGFETVLADMQTAGITIPAWVEAARRQGSQGFYHQEGIEIPQTVVCSPQGWLPLPVPADEIHLTDLKAKGTLWENPEAALIDLGEGVALYEFRSKGNTLSMNVLKGLATVLDRIETGDFQGLVIGNDAENFSAGANLAEIGQLVLSGQFETIDQLIVQFQTLMQRIHYFPKPIVAAVQGRALGGGCELVMSCPQVVAAAESYIGLVELGVGLIPAGTGTMRMAAWAAERAAVESPHQIQPFLRTAFETVAMAKVAGSAYEAQELGFLPPTAQIVMNSDRRLYVAKQEVLCQAKAGYTPPPQRPAIMVLGRPTRTLLDHAASTLLQGGFISEYDRYLAGQLAAVITGGDLSAPALVSEAYLLQLERQAFVPLLQQPKTQERIAHLLKTKKPLRN